MLYAYLAVPLAQPQTSYPPARLTQQYLEPRLQNPLMLLVRERYTIIERALRKTAEITANTTTKETHHENNGI